MRHHGKTHACTRQGTQFLLGLCLALGLTTAQAHTPGHGDAAAKAGHVGEREGDMDPSFIRYPEEPGVGMYHADYGDREEVAQAFAVGQRSDGRMILAGRIGTSTILPDPLPTRIGIFQLEPDGTYDTGFGILGLQTFDFEQPVLEVVDGFYIHENLGGSDWERIYLLAHHIRGLSDRDRFALICLRRPGTASNAFQACGDFPGGIRFYEFEQANSCGGIAGGHHNIPKALHLERSSEPKIYMAGAARTSGASCLEYEWAVARVHMNGDLDEEFGGGSGYMDGTTTISVPHRNGTARDNTAAYSITTLPDGRIVLGGNTVDDAGNEDALLVRLTAWGDLDASFCATGVVCDTPLEYRNGRRGFTADPYPHPALQAYRVVALAATDGGDVYSLRSNGNSLAIMQRIDDSGGCTAPHCNAVSLMGRFAGAVPTFGTYRPVALHWEGRGSVDYVTVAAWGDPPGSGADAEAYVDRFRTGATTLEADMDFATGPTSGVSRQVITWPNASGTRDAHINTMTTDRQGRIMLAGGARAFAEQRDMAMARLQGPQEPFGDDIFSDGFEPD